MPTHVMVQVAESREISQLPRDVIVNCPCFRWANLTIQDATSLANNVLDAYDSVFPQASQGQYVAKVIDLEGTKPVFPMAVVTRRPGQVAPTTRPREIALCLSFGGGQFQPRQRGRLYILAQKLTSDPNVRPSTTQQNQCLALGTALYNVGGANVDWIVWSRSNQSATGVSRAWVDDEWDTVRSRGQRPQGRVVANF